MSPGEYVDHSMSTREHEFHEYIAEQSHTELQVLCSLSTKGMKATLPYFYNGLLTVSNLVVTLCLNLR